MIEEAVFAILSADAGVQALVSSRIFPLVLPEKGLEFPAVTYQLISDRPESYLLDGLTSARVARIQIDVWGPHSRATGLVALAIRDALECVQQAAAGIAIANAWIDSTSAMYEPGARLYRAQTDWMLLYDRL